ncbi:MAG TPA: family 1 glycosylhydrolase [Polyangiaceae bacterium]|jgi:beta-glucosidase|nr:family 1 glycosylhydrolase [Polyangiaceae bacterium]
MFPRSFLFGTATSATQIEGHCPTSDWAAFARRPGRVRGGDTPDVACDSWRRWPDDVALQRALGMQAYRLGLEWARIEPRPGETDHAALDTYRAMLGALRDAGIEPMVTLHHFTLPGWLAAKGGVLARDFAARLAAFARVAAGALGDLARLWITVNEPNVLAAHGYLLGVWPPAKKSPRLAFLAQRRLLAAHDAAYRALKDARGDGVQVGVAHHLRDVEPARPGSRRDRAAAALFRRVFNDAFAAAVCQDGTQDFFGINYYSRDVVRFSARHAGELFVSRGVPPGAEVSDLGWEVYPAGLGHVVRAWARRSGRPVYVTENGIADASDTKRGPFLVAHLRELARLLAEGVDVRGYFHWSLLDNFEWAEGYAPRFGLCAVDFGSGERTPRPSAKLYARIARERELPAEPRLDGAP